jgi:Ca2+-binding RTX toxin-like protein
MPSTLIRSSTDEVAIRLTAAFYGVAPSNATLNSYKAEVARVGEMAFARNLSSAFDNLTNAQLTATVLNNLGVSAASIGAAGFAALEPALTTLFGAYAKSERGQIVLNITRLLAGLEGDVTYGSAAATWNTRTDAAFAYSSSATATTASSITSLVGDGFRLTAGTDVASNTLFTANPVYTPGGNTFVNSLQDEDVLTGVSEKDVLNVIIGSVSDNAELRITPKLRGIETVNVEVTAGNFAPIGGQSTGINFQDATGLTEVNVNRITATNATVLMDDLPASVVTLGARNSTKGGTLTFDYREDVLVGSESLNVTAENLRLRTFNLTEGGDSGEDRGYFFENVTVTFGGASNNIDNMQVSANTREDVAETANAGTADQTVNLRVNSATEINSLDVSGAEAVTIDAKATLIIAADERNTLQLANDGITSTSLRSLTITGNSNVTIDGLDGHISGTIDGDAVANPLSATGAANLTVDASALTGNLSLGVVSGADGNSSAVFATRLDKDVKITSGSGNDTIEVYGGLAGDVSTGAGDDVVSVNSGAATETAATRNDVEGISTISTGAGNDTVRANNLGATANDNNQASNSGFTTVAAASIDTGDGNDTVTVAALQSEQDWDNFVLTDGNVDDLYFVKGASISTGADNDAITFTTAAEGTSISAGAGNDTLSVELTAATVLAADTDPNRTVLNNVATVGAALGTKEVTAAGTAADMLGAVVDMGEGDDAASFSDAASTATEAQTIVGTDALLGGGAGADVLNVTALDATTVAAATSAADSDPGVTGTQADVNATITGIETINLTISNQIVDDGGVSATVNETLNNAAVNDNVDTDGAITLDVLRVDSALTTINLASNETAMLENPANERHQAGTQTTFTLNNHRSSVALSLTANEATGVSGAGALADDRMIAINRDTGVVTTVAASDVTLNINLANGEAVDNSLSLTARAGSGLGDGAFDLTINAGATATDLIADADSTTDDNAARIENLTVTFDDANSHGLDVAGFGDAPFRASRAPAAAADVSSTASTSLTVNTGAAAGKAIDINNVNADTIRVNNAAGTAVTAANVTIRVDASNNYNITTGSGTDTVDLRADDVRSDDTVTSVNRADVINLGTGRDVIVVNGGDDIGRNNNIDTAGAQASTIIDDDVFTTMTGVEQITVAVGAGGTQQITLDEAARATGIDTIRVTNGTGAGTYTGNYVIGNNFVVATTADNANGELTDAASALVIDASRHVTGLTVLNIESKDDDSDVDLVNLDIRASATNGARIDLKNTGSEAGAVELRLTSTATAGVANVVTAGAGAVDGSVQVLVQGPVAPDVSTRSIDKIVMVEGAAAAAAEAASDTFTIAAAWTRADTTGVNNVFTFDASALLDTDTNAATGGATITVEAGDTARLAIMGTANSDTITGGDLADTLSGNAGNDIILGGLGADSISGGTGNDVLQGGAAADTIDGGTGNDTITGGAGADSLTGGDSADTFVINAVTDSIQSSADTVVGFVTGSDKIEINQTIGAASVVNLGRFATVPGVGEGDNSLDGTTNAARLFDAFYSSTGQLAIDADGNGDITDNADIVINSAGAIGAGDINYNLTLTAAGNTVRLGQGVDTIVANGNNNVFVVVGSLTAAKVAEYSAAGAAATVTAAVEPVLPFNDLLAVRSTTEVTAGDSITANGTGDTLHVYGIANLTSMTLQGIETLVVHSDVTISAAQLATITNIAFSGGTTHAFKVINADGTLRTPTQVRADLAAKNVTVENATATTQFLFGSGTGASAPAAQSLADIRAAVVDTVTATAITSALLDADVSSIVTAASNLTLTVNGTGLSTTAEGHVLGGLAKVKAGGITNLTLDVGQYSGSASTLDAKLAANALTLTGTSSADSIDLTGYGSGVTVNSGAGNDTVTSGAGADTINLGSGNNTVVIGTNTTGVVVNGSVISTTGLDKVTGFAYGDTLQLPFTASAIATTLAGATGTTIAVVRGTYSASANAFVPSTSGQDSMVVFDADGTSSGSVLQGVVIVGNATLTGSTGSGGFGG